jgi:hypothetical protein
LGKEDKGIRGGRRKMKSGKVERRIRDVEGGQRG